MAQPLLLVGRLFRERCRKPWGAFPLRARRCGCRAAAGKLELDRRSRSLSSVSRTARTISIGLFSNALGTWICTSPCGAMF